MDMIPIEVLVKEKLAGELLDDGFAEVAFRRSDAKFREMVKCKIAGNTQINREVLNKLSSMALKMDVNSNDIYDIRRNLKEISSNSSRIINTLETIPSSLKNLSTRIDGVYQGINTIKGLSYINAGLTMVNIAVDVVGFIVIRNNLGKLNDTVISVAKEIGRISTVQKNSKIGECNKLIMRFNSLSEKIQDGDNVDLDNIDSWLTDSKAFISEMLSNLVSDALGVEILLNMIYSLLPSYTIMLGYYSKKYYFLKKKRPANYDIYLSLFGELIAISFDKKLKDYYFIDKHFSFIEINDIINSQFLMNLNNKVFIEDQQYLLETLKTKRKYDSFERRIDDIVEEHIIEMIPALSEGNDMSQEECRQLFGVI